jgi:hypothetical protein
MMKSDIISVFDPSFHPSFDEIAFYKRTVKTWNSFVGMLTPVLVFQIGNSNKRKVLSMFESWCHLPASHFGAIATLTNRVIS